jgi:hypothetical protein
MKITKTSMMYMAVGKEKNLKNTSRMEVYLKIVAKMAR